MSYQDLTNKLRWVTFADNEQVRAQPATQPLQAEVASVASVAPWVTEVQPAQVEVQQAQVEVQQAQVAQPQTQPTQQTASKSSTSLDDLLNGLV